MPSLQHTLKLKGLRLTQQRQQVFACLSKKPQSAKIITQQLSQGTSKVDQATVYRSLECLVDLGLATKTIFKDKTAHYELATGSHHHHVTCDSCGKVKDVPLNETMLLQEATLKTQFLITNHSLEFFGVCKSCQTQAKRRPL